MQGGPLVPYKWSCKPFISRGYFTPFTHLFSAIYTGYNAIILTSRGPPCVNYCVYQTLQGEVEKRLVTSLLDDGMSRNQLS